MKILLEGKAKKIFYSRDKDILIQHFKDDATAFNNKRKKKFINKGIINNDISANIFKFLNANKINTHFIKKISDREQLIRKVKIIPLEVVIRNYTAGSLCTRTGVKHGKKISPALIEFYFKSDKLGDPFLGEQHIEYLNLCNRKEIIEIKKIAFEINTLLIKYFKDIKIILVDFKIEFGKLKNKFILADEISPDSCRLWDISSKKSLDKDIFRKNNGNLLEAYKNVSERIKKKYNEI